MSFLRYAEKATSYKVDNSHRLLGCRYRDGQWVFLIEATRRRVKRMHGSDGVGETNTKTNICFSTRKCSSSHSRLRQHYSRRRNFNETDYRCGCQRVDVRSRSFRCGWGRAGRREDGCRLSSSGHSAARELNPSPSIARPRQFRGCAEERYVIAHGDDSHRSAVAGAATGAPPVISV